MLEIADKEGIHYFDWAVVSIDETEYWKDDIKECCDKIYTVYLVNKAEITHCCELSGSYWLEPLYYEEVCNEGLTDKEIDWLESEIMDASIHEQGGYYSEHYHFDSEIDVNSFFQWDIEEETIEEAIENLKEYLMCNHVM